MPSPLETLVKILKLEREQGCKDTAVIGGLSAFCEKWAQEAHAQARRPEHHLLIDELVDLMRRYQAAESKTERHKSVSYMLDRITGRVPPPADYQAKLSELQTAAPPQPAPSAPPVEAPAEQPAAPPAETRAQGQPARPSRKQREKGKPRGGQPRQSPPQRESGPRQADEDEDDGDRGEVRYEMAYDTYEAPPASGGASGSRPQLDLPPPPRLARPPRRPRPPLTPDEALRKWQALRMSLHDPKSEAKLKGVGPNVAALLERLGIITLKDLLWYLPRDYDDYRVMRTISRLEADIQAKVSGTVISTQVRVGKNGRRDFFMIVDDGSARLGVTFFGQHYLSRQIKPGQQLVLRGTTSRFGGQIQMTNPEWDLLDAEDLITPSIVPVYGLTEGLSGRTLRKLMKRAVTEWATPENLPDYIPEATLERADLADLDWAIQNLHFPESQDHLHHARTRFIFDELLLLQLAVLRNRREWQAVAGQPLAVSDDFLNAFIQSVFPYELTGAQRRAIEAIRQDVSRDVPMNRLLQGDVGSGKTAVATVALGMALANGKQAALMAPTGILAEQHYRGISAALERYPGEQKPVVALLTSALTTGERESIYRGIADGSIDVVIGTHAVIQEGVVFKDLAVAIIDEQHRFGVEQRGALRGKGVNPHLLVMTATPIPRTLALTLYADLDLSVLDEMPPGRIPIKTRVVQPVQRERVYQFVEQELDKGRQAFIVHPLVEASDKIEAPAAVEAYERLKQVFFRYKVGLLHGRMKPAEKDEVMAAFAAGQFQVLVTTSVAEVGVNVPNASVMVIEGADRFGLAQLHQFRGRVGRGEHPSYCLLLSDSSAPEARERLQVMEQTTDGFQLAEMDWRLRGAGDLLGTRQSGGSKLQLAQQMTPQLVELAQREARTIYEEDPDLTLPQHALLAQEVSLLHNQRSEIS